MFNYFKYTKNDYEFRVFALRRSGSNAIVNWIINHFNDNEVFYLSADPKEFLLKNKVLKKKQQASIDNYRMPQLRQIHSNTTFRKDKRCLIYRYEDCELNESNINKITSRYYGKSETKINIIILRDVYNMTASRMAYYSENYYPVMVGDWYKKLLLQYLIYFHNRICFQCENSLFINYNQWFSDIDYRMYLSECLNLKFTDKGLNQIVEYGNGSSFDGKKFQGKAQQMDTMNRWRKYENNETFKSITNDPKIKELNCTIFGRFE